MTCSTGKQTIDQSVFTNALEDLQTIENIANSEGLTTPSRLSGDVRTLQGRLLEIGGYIVLNGGVWAAGIEFNGYDEFAVYNGTAYKVKSGSTLPITTTATPDLNDFEPFSIVTTETEIFENVDLYNRENLADFTDFVFSSLADMISATSVGGETVVFKIGQALKINGENDKVSCYIVNDTGDGIDLGGGLYAKEVFAKIADDTDEISPISTLDPSNDARNFPKPGISLTDLSPLSVITEEYSAGVLAQNNKIYCAPNQGTAALEINISTGEYTEFGSITAAQGFVSGALAPNGKIFYVSETGTKILELDPFAKTLTEHDILNPSNTGFGGIVLGSDGLLYLIPSASTQAVEFDPDLISITYIGSTYSTDTGKWSGGCIGSNGKIYGAPYNNGSILEIDTVGKTTRLITIASVTTFARWSGATMAQNSKIYFTPFNENKVGILNTADDSIEYIDVVMTGNNKYKSGILGFNGRIYHIPYESDYILETNPVDNSVSEFIYPTISDTKKFFGACSDVNGIIYSVPANSDSKSLVIDGIEGTVKWQISAYSNKF